MLDQALELANRHEMPVQFHAGFGDPDLDLRQANPLHLRLVLEDPRFVRVPIVLLHLYPFVREGATWRRFIRGYTWISAWPCRC